MRLERDEDSAAIYLTIGLDPVGQFKQWSKADKPYRLLRACLEVTDYLAVHMQATEQQE